MLLTDFNGTTPQSKVVENAFKALTTLDITKLVPFVSKDFKFQSFPKIDDLPDEPVAKFLERYGAIISSLKKLEVGIHPTPPWSSQTKIRYS